MLSKNIIRKPFPPDLAAFLFLIVVVLWFNHEMVWNGKVPFYRDLGPYTYPMRFSLAQSFRAGELPLWDRHVGMGFPLLANFQSGAFYPLHFFYLLLPFFAAVRAVFLSHYLIAALGAYLLCRQWKYPPTLALMGAVLFTLGGTIVSFSNLMNHFQTAVWLPLVILQWERVLHSGSWKNFILFTFLLLIQFLAGSPEVYVMCLGLLFLDGLRFKREGTEITYRNLFFPLLVANALVAGMAMVQILPTLELLRESRAQHIITYQNSVYWSLHPMSLINLFFLDKEVSLSKINGLRLFFTQETPFIISLYMGAIALPGVCLWFSKSSTKEKTVLLGLVIMTLILAMGGYTPVYFFLFKYIEPISLIRFPEKFFFLTHVLLLFIILRGLFRFMHHEDSLSRGSLLVLSSICILLFLSYLFLRFDSEPLGRFVARTLRSPLVSSTTLGTVSAVLVHLERQIGLTFGIVFLMVLWKMGRLRSNLFRGLILALVFIDLGSAHRPYQYFLKPDFVYKSPRILPTPDPQPHRLFYYPGQFDLHPNYYLIPKAPSFAELNSLVFSNLLPNTGVFHGFDYMQGLDALERWSNVMLIDFVSKLPPERQFWLLRALNVKYITSFQPLTEGDITLLRHFPEHSSWLYTLNRSVPRAYIVPKVTVEREPLAILARLSSAEFNPINEVILERSLPISEKKDLKAEAKIVKYTNNHVDVQASLNGSGILVLADSFYPGWRVYVDGNETKILRANFLFRGVPLTAGQHLVEFRYQPRSFTIGLSISLITLCGIFLWSVALSLLKRRTTAESIKAGNSV